MACKLEGDALFHTLAGVAQERRDEIGDAADLANDPVWVAALCFLGLEDWDDVPSSDHHGREPRGVIEAMRPASAADE